MYVYALNSLSLSKYSFALYMYVFMYSTLLLLFLCAKCRSTFTNRHDPTHSAKLFVLKAFYDVDKKWSKASNY